MKRKPPTATAEPSALSLSPEGFYAFYTRFMALRFPLDVAEVLEWRYLINHAVDHYSEPSPTPDYREFRDKLDRAIDALGIDNKRHRERLLRILAMLRELHYAHSLQSRRAEEQLRLAMRENRVARKRSVQYGLIFLVAAILGAISWLAAVPPGWLLVAATLLSTWFSLDYFHSLPILDRQLEQLKTQLNGVLRQRVTAINWKALTRQLALVLGFKQIRGVEVLRTNSEAGYAPGWYH